METKGYRLNRSEIWKALAKKGSDAVSLDLDTSELIEKEKDGE